MLPEQFLESSTHSKLKECPLFGVSFSSNKIHIFSLPLETGVASSAQTHLERPPADRPELCAPPPPWEGPAGPQGRVTQAFTNLSETTGLPGRPAPCWPALPWMQASMGAQRGAQETRTRVTLSSGKGTAAHAMRLRSLRDSSRDLGKKTKVDRAG